MGKLGLLLIVCLAGCATPVGVRWVGADRAHEQLAANALRSGIPSQFTEQTLGTFELSALYDEDPPAAIAKLHDYACHEPGRDLFFALAELSYLEAIARHSKPRYLAAAIYAQEYMYVEGGIQEVSAFDPNFRLACEIQNRALLEFLKNDDGSVAIETGWYELPFGEIRVMVNRAGFGEEFTRFLPASEFAVRGLRTRYTRFGIGVPLIARREVAEDATIGADRVPPRIKVPATVFLRMASNVNDFARGKLKATLELVDPYDVAEIELRGERVALEADFTAPIAYSLEESPIWEMEIGGFLSGEKRATPVGLFLTREHKPGRIPVVLVHGTASSVARWAPLLNALTGDPELRARYEFWLFQYTTGNPIAYSAMLLREALNGLCAQFDPEGKDPALRQMIVMGHSQGGIVTRMQAISPKDAFIRAVCSKGLDELNLSAEARDLLQRGLEFERVPYVRRVIFLATPHRGSFLADSWYSRLAASFVTMPKQILDTTQQLFERNDAFIFKGATRGVPTSIANMTGSSPFLRTMNEIPLAPGVIANSIIAVRGDGPPAEGNDGLVEYTSAHFDGAESEYVVRSGHSCQENQLAIREVRRILHAHLRAVEGKR